MSKPVCVPGPNAKFDREEKENDLRPRLEGLVTSENGVRQSVPPASLPNCVCNLEEGILNGKDDGGWWGAVYGGGGGTGNK